jgi:glycosyltransferase involved in cell wall biosynthesis
MKLLFVNVSSLVFDVATPDRAPLGGSESSLCYLARHLAKTGHTVTLAGRLPKGSAEDIQGVRHRPIEIILEEEFFAGEKFEAIFISNAPFTAPHLKEISPSSYVILWDHMAPDQPAMQHLPTALPLLDAVVFVSEWQKAETEKVFGRAKASFVIGNGLTPAFENMFSSSQELREVKECRAAYTSTPFRGLKYLLDAMDQEPGLTLDVFSSMHVYQKADDEYASLYERARENSRITYHGAVSQTELARRLRASAFLTYPCVFPETFCLAALEAMAAGMKVVSTRLGALESTTMGYADLIDIDRNHSDRFVDAFAHLMEANVAAFKEAPEEWAEKMFDQVRSVNRHCTWALRAVAWEQMVASLRTHG